LLSISSRKKGENNYFQKEIKYDRNTDFKNITPLEMSKKEKFVFEDENKFYSNINDNYIVSNYYWIK